MRRNARLTFFTSAHDGDLHGGDVDGDMHNHRTLSISIWIGYNANQCVTQYL
ncbi:MAG: hypothetical protein WCI11_00750 [Candidatus Methylumidiphilus sp.]